MKLQNFVIIFIIIIIPIILVFSYYLNLQTETIRIQTDYDSKLLQATSEMVEAFEINTTEWTNDLSTLANVKRRDLLASINVFVTSLSNKLGISGSAKENVLNYIPAIVYVMYDGYYIYSPTYVPKAITDDDGRQIFYYEKAKILNQGNEFTIVATQSIKGITYEGQPIFEDNNGTLLGQYEDKTFRYTLDPNDAEKEYKHVLKTFVPYTKKIGDYTINYTLDNYVRVFGKDESNEGYLYDDGETIEINGLNTVKVNNSDIIEPEILTENVPVKTSNGSIEIQNIPYIYNSNNDKRYYDEKGFFTLDSNYDKSHLTSDIDENNSLAEYKKILVKKNNTEFLELYQMLNKNEGNKLYYKSDNMYYEYKGDTISIDRNKDYSAVNYYIEKYFFNIWFNNTRLNKEEVLNQKRQAIIDNINENLNLSIANYNANSKINYKMPEISDEEWDQALSNISAITFFQGVKIGLKTYNNYIVATSSGNNEYVSKDTLYFIVKDDEYYHMYGCEQKTNNIAQRVTVNKAYRNIEFKPISYPEGYYYKHSSENLAQRECFYCIVNRKKIEFDKNLTIWNTAFLTSLARERYIQSGRTRIIDISGAGISDNLGGENGGQGNTEPTEPTIPEIPDGPINPVCSHNYEKEYISNGVSSHTIKCTHCGETIETEAPHDIYYEPLNNVQPGFGNITVISGTNYHQKKCRLCNEAIGRKEECVYANKWTYDERQHWHQCSLCGRKTLEENHSFNIKGICTICGYNRNESSI